MKKHYPVVIEQDKNGVFIIECSVFDGCRSYGKTMDEALSNIREAIQVCIDEIDMGVALLQKPRSLCI